jgi:hypothetical protein
MHVSTTRAVPIRSIAITIIIIWWIVSSTSDSDSLSSFVSVVAGTRHGHYIETNTIELNILNNLY